MKPLFSVCILFILSLSTHGQEKIPEFGKIDASELNMKECPFEKGAAALNLVRTAKISMDVKEFSGTPVLTTEYRTRIKIFNKQGFSAASIRIPYESRDRATTIKDLEAYIYSPDKDGGIRKEKVEKREIFKDRSKNGNALNYISFTFPDLSDGVIIEYRYTQVDKNTTRIQPWFFQDQIPTAVSQVTTDIPAYAYLIYHIVVSDPLQKDSAYKKHYHGIYDETICAFTMRNIHSFRPEPLMYSMSDNLQRVEFSLSPASFLSSFLSNEGKMREQSSFLLRARFFGYQCWKPVDSSGPFIDSVRKLNRKEDKIAAIYNCIRKNIEFDGERTFYCDSIDRCWKTRSGSSAEMNLLLVNLLNKAGVNCMPVLVSTHANGNPDPDFPTISQFDGVDVYIRDTGVNYIVDCTQKELSYKIPPYDVLNSEAYLVDQNTPGWIFILDERMLMKNIAIIDAEIDSTGKVSGTANLSDIGYAKLSDEQESEKKPDKPDESFIDAGRPDVIFDKVAVDSSRGPDTLIKRVSFHFLPQNTDKIYFINPFLFSRFKINPFRDSLRLTDVDFGCSQSFHTRMRIKIAGNFSVGGLPKDIFIAKDDSSMSFERKTSIDGQYLAIDYSFTLKRAIFIKEDYASLKSFFDKFYALLNDDIALARKG